jgi:hypothetical protein
MIKQFIELYPNRGGSLVKHDSGTWREVSRFYDLPDEEIVRAISSAQTLVRAANWDIRTKFTVLNINAESSYHNQLSLWQLQNSLAQKGVHKIRVYQSSESSGWHIYIFWNDWVGSTRSAAVISAILMAAGFELAPETLEVFPSDNALRLPLQSGFSWLNESGRIIVRRSEISLEGALALYLDEVTKFANEASWLDSDHANEVARLFQQQRARLTVVKPMAPVPVAEELVHPEPDAKSELAVEEILVPDFVREDSATNNEDNADEVASDESQSKDFDAEDTLSPALVSQAPPLHFSTQENPSAPESASEETWTLDLAAQAAFAADVVAEKTCSQQPAHDEASAPKLVHNETVKSQSEEPDLNDLEFTTEGMVSPELIAERLWTPELVAEQAWPLELDDDESDTSESAAEEAPAPGAEPTVIEVEPLPVIDESSVEPVLTPNDFWTFEPAVSDNVSSANVDEDYPPVVEQIMQIRPAAPKPISQQLSLPLPLQDVQSSRTVPEVAEASQAPLTVPESVRSTQPGKEESMDFSPSKVVSLPQRASGIVRELVEEEIPEIAFDVEPESESQSKLKAEDNSWAGGAKHAKASDDNTLLHGKQRLNNVVNSGPSEMQRRKRPPRNTTRERPSPGFPPTQT